MAFLTSFYLLQSHLETLIRALKDYIMDQKKEILKKSLSNLKKQLDFDPTAVDHLHYALYKFQDAVIAVLRGVSIKPHWMFALDNLVRNAVHVGLMILSPELAANLANLGDGVDEEDEADELSNSGVSTVNSTKVKHSGKESDEGKFLMDQVKLLKIENAKLLNELLESQRNFQSLVKSIPHDQGLFSEALRNLTQQLSMFTKSFERSVSFGYFSDEQNNRKSSLSIDNSPSLDESPPGKNLSIPPLFKNPQLKSPYNARQSHDLRLTDWLVRHGFDEDSRAAVLHGDFNYEDFIYETDKDDIRRIGLRTGTEVRMWRHIQSHRRKYKSYQLESNNPLTNGFACSSHDGNCNSYDSTSSATNSNSSNYDSCCGGEEKE